MVVKFTKLLQAEEYRGKLGMDAETYISDSLHGALRIEALLDALLDYWKVTEQSGLSLSSVDCVNSGAFTDAATTPGDDSEEWNDSDYGHFADRGG